MNETTGYETYILRCWAEHRSQSDEPDWRFVLIDAASGSRRVFTKLGALLDEIKMEFTPDDTNERDDCS